jgi:hypothetical protein
VQQPWHTHISQRATAKPQIAHCNQRKSTDRLGPVGGIGRCSLQRRVCGMRLPSRTAAATVSTAQQCNGICRRSVGPVALLFSMLLVVCCTLRSDVVCCTIMSHAPARWGRRTAWRCRAGSACAQCDESNRLIPTDRAPHRLLPARHGCAVGGCLFVSWFAGLKGAGAVACTRGLTFGCRGQSCRQ